MADETPAPGETTEPTPPTIETHDDGTAEPSDAEKARNEAAEEEANLSPKERRERRRKEREEQQEAAGQDPDDDPKPLSESGNVDAPVTTEVAGEEVALPLDTVVGLHTLARRGTVEDRHGIERIVLPSTEEWEPAQVEPDPKEVARLEKVQSALQAQRDERLSVLTGGKES